MYVSGSEVTRLRVTTAHLLVPGFRVGRMSEPAPPHHERLDPELRRTVVALLVAAFGSACAIAALTIALGKQVYDLTGSELDLGLLGLAEFTPSLLLVFVSGPIADRFDRRTVGRIALGLEAVVCLALAWYAGTDPTSVTPIFALVVAYGIARAFANPAIRSLPADSVPPERLPWLVARQAVTWQSASIVGPVVAGFLYAAGVALPFVFVVVLLVLSAVSLTFVRPVAHHAVGAVSTDDLVALDAPVVVADVAEHTLAGAGEDGAMPARRPSLHDALEGLRFVRHHPILLGTISLDLFAVLFGGAVALLPAIAEERLGVGAVGLGWLRAAVGIGAASVTLVLTVRPVARHVGKRMLLAVAVFGVGTIILGFTTSYLVAWIALAVLSGADAVSVFIRATLVPLVTPADKRGRVSRSRWCSSARRTSWARSSRAWSVSCSVRPPRSCSGASPPS